MKSSVAKRNYLHTIFEWGVFFKGFNGVWETLSGFLALFVSQTTLTNWFYLVARNELLEDPNDRFINFFASALQNLPHGTKTLAALYILVHGILNVFLAVQLYRAKYWAYSVTIVVMILFLVYQIYRISAHHSIFLTVISLFDVFFIALMYHEFRYQRSRV